MAWNGECNRPRPVNTVGERILRPLIGPQPIERVAIDSGKNRRTNGNWAAPFTVRQSQLFKNQTKKTIEKMLVSTFFFSFDATPLTADEWIREMLLIRRPHTWYSGHYWQRFCSGFHRDGRWCVPRSFFVFPRTTFRDLIDVSIEKKGSIQLQRVSSPFQS